MDYIILIIAGIAGIILGRYLGKKRALLLRRSADSDGQALKKSNLPACEPPTSTPKEKQKE